MDTTVPRMHKSARLLPRLMNRQTANQSLCICMHYLQSLTSVNSSVVDCVTNKFFIVLTKDLLTILEYVKKSLVLAVNISVSFW